MIVKMAWRNVWRTKVRSAVVIIAIAIGLWAGIFASAFVVGMMDQKLDSVVRLELSHFQVHHPKFRDEFLPEFTVAESQTIANALSADENVMGFSERIIGMPMISSTGGTGSIKVTGVVPADEAKVTDIHKHVVEGKYFEGINRNPILLSTKTADKYKLKVRSKLVLTVQDINGELVGEPFRVVGIYDSHNPMYDGMNAFVELDDMRRMLGLENQVHEIAVVLTDHALADTTAKTYQKAYKDVEILPWMDLAAGMRMMIDMKDIYTVIIVGIILVALLFSIINTMLMAVLERVREIGMLMAVGMTKGRVFRMIMIETVFLALIGGPLGLLISWATIAYFGSTGIDLSNAAYADAGFGQMVYPQLGLASYVQVAIMVFGMAILAAIYPAIKALKLNPVEAIRKI